MRGVGRQLLFFLDVGWVVYSDGAYWNPKTDPQQFTKLEAGEICWKQYSLLNHTTPKKSRYGIFTYLNA